MSIETFIAAACLTMSLTPCPEVYTVPDAIPSNGILAWGITRCDYVAETRVCELTFHKASLDDERRVEIGSQWSVGENLVLHEMCHAFQWQNLKQWPSHLAPWKACMEVFDAWGPKWYDEFGRYLR